MNINKSVISVKPNLFSARNIIKKISLLIMTIGFFKNVYATNYYLSNAGNDSNNGKSITTPWKSLIKIQGIRSTLTAGDSVLFKRGDVFTGSINMTIINSDVSKPPIVFSAYGDTNLPMPVFSGEGRFPASTTWQTTNTPNIYKRQLTVGLSVNYPSYFLRDGKPLNLGRFPNFNPIDAGALLMTGVSQTTINNTNYTVVKDTINLGINSIDWTGAQLVTMQRYWAYTRGRVVSSSPQENTITVSTVGYAISTAGYKKGYFLQNHVGTLDQEGEYAYDKATNTFYLYTLTEPSSSTFYFATSNIGIDFNGSVVDGLIIDNIHFRCFNDAAIRLNSSKIGNRITIQNCKFTYCYDALSIKANSNITIKNNEISDCRNNGVWLTAKNSLIEKNLIKRIGLNPGGGDEINNNYVGVNLEGQNNICRGNTIDSIGFNGIRFEGQNLLLERNEISNFTICKHDGGGIYSFNGFFNPDPTVFTNYKYGNNIIKENIIHDGVTSDKVFTLYDFGNRLIGSNRSAGIYNDENTRENYVVGNIIYNMKGHAVIRPKSVVSDSIMVSGNFIYNCQTPDMLSLSKGITNHMSEYSFNPGSENDPKNPVHTWNITDNQFIETFPIKSSYTISKNDNSLIARNSFVRFDYNQDSTFFKEYNKTIPLKLVDFQQLGKLQNKSFENNSYWINVQPEIKKPNYSQELITNGNFNSGTTNWTFSKLNLSSTIAAVSTPLQLDGSYAKIAITGGSFTAVNHYFELSQPVNVNKNKLYELNFTFLSTLQEDTTQSITIQLGDSRSETIAVKNKRTFIKKYLVPYTDGSVSLKIKVTVPDKSEYYFDNFSLREITNYSTNQADYEIFKINRSESTFQYTPPAINPGWYYLDVKQKTIVNSPINIKPYQALYLIKTNRTQKQVLKNSILIK